MTSSQTLQEIHQQIAQLSPEQLQQLIEFLDSFQEKPSLAESKDDSAWNAFAETLERNKVKTGILDLAHQHDHYLYGKPKQE